MDLSWIPAFMHELGAVPAGVQFGVMGLLYFAVSKLGLFLKQRKAEQNGTAPAPTTQTAVEDLKKELLQDVEEQKNTLRDLVEQSQRVADIQLALATKIDNNTEKMIAINTNVENLVRR